jgi:hypothetical protein
MFRQDNPNPASLLDSSRIQGSAKKRHRFFYAIFAVLAIIMAIIAALFVPQSVGSPMELTLNYAVGDHMVYETTNTVTNQMVNTSLSLAGITNSQSFNSTTALDVISSDNENYVINETIQVTSPIFALPTNLMSSGFPSFKLNISKTNYYNNFIAPGGPLIFYNYTSNPTISDYLAQQTVKVGDVWKIPVNTGNASLGLTGDVTLTFAGIQDLTVPAGTFHTMRIEVTSNVLSVHSDGSSIIKIPNGMSLQLNGTSYIEQGTCRLIKADLTQLTTTNAPGIDRTSTLYTEKTLVEFTKP